MKITKGRDYVLLSNENGEYHLSHKKYEKLGKEKAIELALSEITKKKNTKVLGRTIDFQKARAMGFCEYGIEDFCKQLHLDITKKYTLVELKEALTLPVFISYPEECIKLFGRAIFDKFGGIKKLLSENKTRGGFNLVVRYGKVPERTLRLLSCEIALSCLHHFENAHPNDSRPRDAINARLDHLQGLISDEELSSASNAACGAASNAASSAASNVAYSAASNVAYSAAYIAASSSASNAASSAASSAAYIAACGAASNAASNAAYIAASNAAYIAASNVAYKPLSDMLINAIDDNYELYELFLKKAGA